MRCLNRQRANIVFSHMLLYGRVLSPTEVSERERIFEKGGILRWVESEIIGHCRIGVSLQTLLARVSTRKARTGSLSFHTCAVSELFDLFGKEAYILWPGTLPGEESLIVLKEGCSQGDKLKAWAHALLFAQGRRERLFRKEQEVDDASFVEDCLVELKQTLDDTRRLFDRYTETLQAKGWDLDNGALETQPGTRVQIDARK